MHSCVLLLYDDGHFEDYAIWYQTYLITDNCVEFDTWCSPDNRVISVTYSVAQKYGHDIKLDTQNLPGWGDVSLNFRRLLRVVFTPSAKSVRAEDNQESDNDTENDSQETESSSLETSTFFTLKVSVNIVRTLMCTGHWSWNVLNAFGTISTRFVLYAITRSPRRELHQRALSSISRLRSSYTQIREDVGNQFLLPF